MDEIKKILAPTDLSDLSAAGIRYALRLAEAIEAEVTIYHVVDYHALTRQPPPRFNRAITFFWRGTKPRYRGF